MLPFLSHVIQFFTLDVKKLISLNLVGYLIASLSSEQQDIRFLSYNLLGQLQETIEVTEKFLGKFLCQESTLFCKSSVDKFQE
jgi:hypothetical protein